MILVSACVMLSVNPVYLSVAIDVAVNSFAKGLIVSESSGFGLSMDCIAPCDSVASILLLAILEVNEGHSPKK